MLETQALDIISLNIWQVLISLCNLALLFLILKRFLFRPVQNIFRSRRDQVDGLYARAEEARAAAEADKDLYEARMARAETEARDVIRTATAKANAMSDEILADTGRRVDEMKARAEADIAQERKQAVNALKDDVAGLSLDIAEKVLGREVSEDDHSRLIDECIRGLDD